MKRIISTNYSRIHVGCSSDFMPLFIAAASNLFSWRTDVQENFWRNVIAGKGKWTNIQLNGSVLKRGEKKENAPQISSFIVKAHR